MFIKVGDPMSIKAKVRDSLGRAYPYVFSYDTVTKEAEIVLCTRDSEGRTRFAVGNKEAVKAKVVLTGSYLEIDGKRVD